MIVFLRAAGNTGHGRKDLAERVQGMARDVKSDEFLFKTQTSSLGISGRSGMGMAAALCRVSPPTGSCLSCGHADPGRRVKRPVHDGKKLPATVTKGIHGTALDEVFHDPLVDLGQVYPAGEVKKVLERPMAFPFLEDNGYSRFPDALDGAKAKAHIIAINGKAASLELMSGGRTLMPISRQTLIYQLTFSATVITLLRKAAIYSTG